MEVTGPAAKNRAPKSQVTPSDLLMQRGESLPIVNERFSGKRAMERIDYRYFSVYERSKEINGVSCSVIGGPNRNFPQDNAKPGEVIR